MGEKGFTYIMLDGKTYRITIRVMTLLKTFIETGSVKQACEKAGLRFLVGRKVLKAKLLVRWIERRGEMKAKREDFTPDELHAFLIDGIRCDNEEQEEKMKSKAFGKRIKCAELYSKINDIGAANDIGTIHFKFGQGDGLPGRPGVSPSPEPNI